MRVGSYLDISELSAAPATPASGRELLYMKSGGMYYKNAAGTETGPLGAAGGGGSSTLTVTSVTATYSATASGVVLASASGGAFTVTLPALATGLQVTVKKTDSSANAVTVTPPSGTLDGAASFVLSTQYAAITVVCDGSSWFVI